MSLAPQDVIAFQEWLASCNKDPLKFALGAFPWGEPSTFLEKAELEDWQITVLLMIKEGLLSVEDAIRIAVASGHGVGKSALVSIIILWAFSTSPDCRGVVTANTETQLKTKTWAELGKWFNMFIGKEFFTLTATALMSKDPERERTWRIDMIPWSEKNPAAFAGLHNKGRRLLLVMDEASEITDIIHEVAEGAMTDADTEIIWLMFGNPTRNVGRFKEAFGNGRFAKFWRTFQLDSRTVKITNKKLFAMWAETYGDDSDFFRVRVKGEFPRVGLMEFFNAADIDAAMTRDVYISRDDPLALGVDVARFGINNSVIFPRKGRDARSIPRRVYNGLSTVQLAAKVFETQQEYRADGVFIDETGVGGGVVDNCRQLHMFVYGINFGAKPDGILSLWGAGGEKVKNKRAEMYCALRAWLPGGALPKDENLRQQMLAIKYWIDEATGAIILETKQDLLGDDGKGISVDDLDALVLTFAQPLSNHAQAGGDYPHSPQAVAEHEYHPYERMN